MITSSSDTAASCQPGLFARLPYRLLLSAVVLMQMAACQTKVDAEPITASKVEQPPSPVDSASSQDAAAERAGVKLHIYKTCHGTIGAQAQLSIERYSAWAKGMPARVTSKEMVVNELYPLNAGNVAKCRSSFEEPAGPGSLDAAAQRYANAIVAFEKALGDGYVHHGRKKAKSAKGLRLPPALASEAKTFEVASANFAEVLGRGNDKIVKTGQAKVNQGATP